MSRSAWKFTSISEYDLYTYLRTYIKRTCPLKFLPSFRLKSLNKWNYRSIYFIHQGKYTVSIRPSIYHISYKLGAFAKTRKPFFFRSKKKKK